MLPLPPKNLKNRGPRGLSRHCSARKTCQTTPYRSRAVVLSCCHATKTNAATMTTPNRNNSRQQSTAHHNGVPDLTPHINDPLEHIRDIWKGFCGNNLDLGDRRRPPIVTIDAQHVPSPEICGFLCMDSQSKVVQPCVPSCSDEQVEIPMTNGESSGTNGHHHSHGATNNHALVIVSTDEEDEDVMEAPQSNTTF